MTYTEQANNYIEQHNWQELPSPSRKYRKIDAHLPFGCYIWLAADRMRIGRNVTASRAANEPWLTDPCSHEYYSHGL